MAKSKSPPAHFQAPDPVKSAATAPAAAVAESPATTAPSAAAPSRSRMSIEAARRKLNERRAKRVTHDLVWEPEALDEADEIVSQWEDGTGVRGVSLVVQGCNHDETLQLVMLCARTIVRRAHPLRNQAEVREACLTACQGCFHQIHQFEIALQWATQAVLCGWSLACDARPEIDELVIPGMAPADAKD